MTRTLVGALLFAAACVGVLYYVFEVYEFPGGMRPSYKATNYDGRLTREASTAKVVIAALDRYYSKHSRFPALPSQLNAYLPATSTDPSDANSHFVCGWVYWQTDNGRGYCLTRKLGWDPVLCYQRQGSKGRWVFEPGDGSPSIPIILKP